MPHHHAYVAGMALSLSRFPGRLANEILDLRPRHSRWWVCGMHASAPLLPVPVPVPVAAQRGRAGGAQACMRAHRILLEPGVRLARPRPKRQERRQALLPAGARATARVLRVTRYYLQVPSCQRLHSSIISSWHAGSAVSRLIRSLQLPWCARGAQDQQVKLHTP